VSGAADATATASRSEAAGSRIGLYVRFTRPFTLLPPLLGVISGAITAWGSAGNPHVLAGEPRQVTASILFTVLLGSLCAGLLNAASNVINQYYDIENDRLNKPRRPLCTGAISMRAGWWYAALLYVAAVLPTWLVVTYPATTLSEKLFAPLARHESFFIFIAGMLFTVVYSAPAFGRTKANAFLANLTIAIPRGCLLKVAGWAMIASIYRIEPWFIGTVFFLFLLGASTTKDFSDMKGDAAAGCRTLPIRFGVRSAARMISPFFVLPWLLLPVGAWVADPATPAHPILTGNPVLLTVLGIGLAVWGGYTVRLILRDPQALAEVENHPSWTHMYLMMMAAQVGFAVAYLV
jgi:4-hydroxybenzoate polyprenyltransferase